MLNLKLLLCISTLFYLCTTNAKADVIKFEQGAASNSPGIVPKQKLQFEYMALSYRNLNKTSDSSYNIGETLIRYGLITNRLEARARIFGLTLENSQIGIDKLSLGTKLGLSLEHGLKPNADLIIEFSIPLDKDLSDSVFAQTYLLTMDHSLQKKLSIISNLALVITKQEQNSNKFTQTQIPYVIGLNYKLTERISCAEELFGTWSQSGNQGNSLGLATLITYAFKENLVGTATILIGLNDNTDPISVNAGLVYRL